MPKLLVFGDYCRLESKNNKKRKSKRIIISCFDYYYSIDDIGYFCFRSKQNPNLCSDQVNDDNSGGDG